MCKEMKKNSKRFKVGIGVMHKKDYNGLEII